MDGPLIRLISRAVRAGAELTTEDGKVRVRGLDDEELLSALRTRRDDITALLTAPTCAACGDSSWIHEADTHIPWCRPDANRRGMQLLRAERPDLFHERSAA